MIMNDPIADMLTRIRNAQVARHEAVVLPASNIKKAIAKILLDEGYVKSVDFIDDQLQGQIKITLKYVQGKQPVIKASSAFRAGPARLRGQRDLPRCSAASASRWFPRRRRDDRQEGSVPRRRRRSIGFTSGKQIWRCTNHVPNRKTSDQAARRVSVTVDGENLVTVKGPKGTLSQKVNKDITVCRMPHAALSRPSDSKPTARCTACTAR
jgi:small subunit ribosomal protein S8